MIKLTIIREGLKIFGLLDTQALFVRKYSESSLPHTATKCIIECIKLQKPLPGHIRFPMHSRVMENMSVALCNSTHDVRNLSC